MTNEIIKYFDAKKAIKIATEKTTEEYGRAIASQAKALAPVREGQLRNSISVTSTKKTWMLNDSAGEHAEGLSSKGLKNGEVYVGSNVDHAVIQEYGLGTEAHPYLRPARELIGGAELAEIMGKYNKEGFNANSEA